MKKTRVTKRPEVELSRVLSCKKRWPAASLIYKMQLVWANGINSPNKNRQPQIGIYNLKETYKITLYLSLSHI